MALYNEQGFLRLPPDSTGKKSGAAARLILQCQDNTTYTFEPGQTITGQTSGATAIIVGLHTEGLAAGDVELYCNLESLVGTFQANENILVGPTVYAKTKTTATLDQFYYQKNVIVDRDNLDRTLKIGEYGALYTRYEDGSPHMSPFGGLITENPSIVRQYVNAYDGQEEEFYQESGVGGSISYISGERAVLLDTNGTSSGAYAYRTSHFYHPYQPGYTSEVNQTVVLGDAGKAGVRRRWGLFNQNDGLYWELDGTNLYVVQRSSTAGSGAVNTRVIQSDWNRDQLDGTEIMDLDVTKANLYFIEYQWLGVGIVRFGVYQEDGTRVTCHVFENPNAQLTSYMRQGTLPLRFEIENTGTAVSSSEMKSICSVVKTLGKVQRQLKSRSGYCVHNRDITSASGEVPILSMRAKSSINGLPNKVLSLLEEVHLAGGGNGHYLFKIRRGSNPTTVSWNNPQANTFAVEFDHAATGFTAVTGEILYSAIIKFGEDYDHNFFSKQDSFVDEIGMFQLADDSTCPIISLTAQALGSSSGYLYASANWKEIWL